MSTRFRLVFAVALAVFAQCALAVAPGPGSLDQGFGTGGVVTGLPFTPASILPRSNGKVVIAGALSDASSAVPYVALARYLEGGALDPAFGQAGVARAAIVGAPPGPSSMTVVSALGQTDGKMVVAAVFSDAGAVLVRFQDDGQLDPAFGSGGIVELGLTVNGYAFHAGKIMQQGDGKIVVAGYAQSATVVRYLATGALDATFGSDGVATPPPNPHTFNLPATAALLADDSIVLGSGVFVVRFGPGGTFDGKFAGDGFAAFDFNVTDLLPTGGKIVVAGTTEEGGAEFGPGQRRDRILERIGVDGTVDASFGDNGKVVTGLGGFRPIGSARIDPWPGDKSTILVKLPDGSMLAVAKIATVPGGTFAVVVTHHDATSGALDPNFGQAGSSAPLPGETIVGAAGLDATGRLLVATNFPVALARFVISAPFSTTTLSAAHTSVAVDETLPLTATVSGSNPSGTVAFTANGALIPNCDAVRVSASSASATCGATLIGQTPEPVTLVASYSGDANTPASTSSGVVVQPKAPATGAAVEFFHAGMGDYFLTSQSSEMAQLDAGVFPGWQRTGQFFLVFMDTAPGALPMCRFFTSPRYAPNGGHFFTPFADECAALRTSPDWIFEEMVLPVRVTGTGICPAGSLPLYRMYNRNSGGVPHHRLVVDRRARSAMALAGWSQEGNGPAAVAMCARAVQ